MTSNAPMTPQQSTVATVTEEEPTIGRLVADASRDISSLIQNEIALAKSELKVSVKAGGTGAGLRGSGVRRRAGDHHARSPSPTSCT